MRAVLSLNLSRPPLVFRSRFSVAAPFQGRRLSNTTSPACVLTTVLSDRNHDECFHRLWAVAGNLGLSRSEQTGLRAIILGAASLVSSSTDSTPWSRSFLKSRSLNWPEIWEGGTSHENVLTILCHSFLL